MWTVMLNIVTKVLPLERIVAFCLNLLLKRVLKDEEDEQQFHRYRLTGQRLTEAIAGFNLALGDGTVSAEELQAVRKLVLEAFEAWAEGKPTPEESRALLKE